MTRTKPQHYHLYADGVKIRRLSHEELQLAWRQDLRRRRTRLLCSVRSDVVWFSKGNHSIFVPLEQLRKILRHLEGVKR